MIPDSISKKLPNSYDSIPTTLLGRLAVDTKYKGQGVGEALLVDALRRSNYTSESVGSFAVIVDPFDEGADRFYKKYGFIQLPDSGKMFIPMKSVQLLFE
jgi:predicted N-acetyltransferase YhbS